MSRLMSVSLTEQAVLERRKTVTRRLGWRFLKPGDRLTLCRKVMGRKSGESLVRLAEVEVVSARREKLWSISEADVAREGFPGWTSVAFIGFFMEHMRCDADREVTRIEWRYLDEAALADALDMGVECCVLHDDISQKPQHVAASAIRRLDASGWVLVRREGRS